MGRREGRQASGGGSQVGGGAYHPQEEASSAGHGDGDSALEFEEAVILEHGGDGVVSPELLDRKKSVLQRGGVADVPECDFDVLALRIQGEERHVADERAGVHFVVDADN